MEKKTIIYTLRPVKKTSEKFTKGEHEVRIYILHPIALEVVD